MAKFRLIDVDQRLIKVDPKSYPGADVKIYSMFNISG